MWCLPLDFAGSDRQDQRSCARRVARQHWGDGLQQGSDIDLTEPTIEETVSRSTPDLRRALVIGLYEEQHEPLLRWARLLTTSDAAAEQLEREAFVKFYGSLHDPVMPDDAARQVRRALFEVARSGVRRNTPQRWQNDVIAPAENATPIDVGVLLVRGVHQLAARQREGIVLRHYGRLSDSQVARELGATLGSTRTHLRRATARLDGLVATLAGEDAELRHVLPLAFDAYAAQPVAEPDVPKLVAMLERHDRLKAVRRAVVAGGALLLALVFAMRAGVAHEVGMRQKQSPEHRPKTTRPLPLPVAPKSVDNGKTSAPTGHGNSTSNGASSSPSAGSSNGSGSSSVNAPSSGSQTGTGSGTGSQSGGNDPVTVGPVAAQQGFWAAGSENSGPSGRQRWQIFGQAPAGATITMSSQWGNAQTTATAEGYSAIVEIRNAPKGVNFPLTVSCGGCGDVTLQIYKYTNPAQPLDETTLSETEPVLLSTTNGTGFIVGGYVPQGASLVTLTTSYGVRTFRVSGDVWGGFIDFPNAAHGATFNASITSDATSAPLSVTLTRP
jgi:DNA-directed RNA polymerase specialized sigma24 family protein